MNAHLVYCNYPIINKIVPLGCANCMKYKQGLGLPESSPQKLSRCSRCKEVHYCSVDCQRAHYPKHKGDCKKNSLIQYKQIHDLNLTKEDRPEEPKEMEILTLCDWSPKEYPDRAITWVDSEGKRHGCKFEEDDWSALDITDEVVYKYESFCFTKSRQCSCYLLGRNSLHDAALVIHASDKTKGVTCGDFWRQMKGKLGERFWECDHVFLEVVKLARPGVYEGWFGS